MYCIQCYVLCLVTGTRMQLCNFRTWLWSQGKRSFPLQMATWCLLPPHHLLHTVHCTHWVICCHVWTLHQTLWLPAPHSYGLRVQCMTVTCRRCGMSCTWTVFTSCRTQQWYCTRLCPASLEHPSPHWQTYNYCTHWPVPHLLAAHLSPSCWGCSNRLVCSLRTHL